MCLPRASRLDRGPQDRLRTVRKGIDNNGGKVKWSLLDGSQKSLRESCLAWLDLLQEVGSSHACGASIVDSELCICDLQWWHVVMQDG